MNAAICEYVDFPVQQILEVLAESDEIKKGSPGLHLDQEIEIAVWAVFATCDGAEHADIGCAVARGYSENVDPLVLQVRHVSALRFHSTAASAQAVQISRQVYVVSAFKRKELQNPEPHLNTNREARSEKRE